MVAPELEGADLLSAVVLLGAAVVAVPVFRRLGLGSIIGYLAAGIAIGPFGLKLFTEAEDILSTAEIGVVLLLFVIGLEMKPSRLWARRKQILGLGALQVGLCGVVLTAVAWLLGMPLVAAFVGAMGFVMTSTAAVVQLLEERGKTTEPGGQRIISVLLFEDLAIVPLLAVVAILSPHASGVTSHPRWLEVLFALGAIVGLVAFARFLLNPIFGLIAAARAREIMTAAALLVVLGAALIMDSVGLSMAMGAFAAGVLLSESSFRHELEADIEPFRGLLLGLFFIAVGMSLNVNIVLEHWQFIVALVTALMIAKAVAIYAIARMLLSGHREGLFRALLMSGGGEFAFVLYTAALGDGIFTPEASAQLTAAVIISMALTPVLIMLSDRLPRSRDDTRLDGIDMADHLSGSVLVIGFGRFGPVASQALVSRGIDTAIIDNDPDMIRAAARFGFKIYYGDGTRLDVLHAAGAGSATAIAVCVERREATDKIVELVKAEFPLAKLLVRAHDRSHAIDLITAGTDFQIRETFESALALGSAALKALGVPDEETDEVIANVRRRDAERLDAQITGGIYAGSDLMKGDEPQAGPLSPPRRDATPLSPETAAVTKAETGILGPDHTRQHPPTPQ